MARTKGSGSENKLLRAELPPEGGTARADSAMGNAVDDMPAGDMNATPAERTMIAARPGIDTPMPGVTDDTAMPRAGEMDDGEPGVLGEMPGESSSSGGEGESQATEATGNTPSAHTTVEVSGEWRLTFTISGVKRV